MKNSFPIHVVLLVTCTLASSWAQNQSGQEKAPNGQQPDRGAAPALEENAVPLSAVDQQALEPNPTTRSMLIPGFYVSQGVNSNVNGIPGTSSSLQGVTRVLGSLSLQRLWRRQDLGLDYVGGGLLYSDSSNSAGQAHQLTAEHRIRWRSGQLSLRDSFSYLPEGSFGDIAFGGTGSLIGVGLPDTGLGTGIGGTMSNFFGPGQFASLGQQPRIANVALVDIIQEVTSRSSFTLAGSYGLVHFTDDAPSSINSHQISTQAGYDHQLTRSDQVGFVYGFQYFRYPAPIGADFMTHLANLLYGHRISERLDLIVGGGPQATGIGDPLFGTRWTISGSGRASLRLRFPQTSLTLEGERYNTSGSGFLAGALSDIVRLTASRPLGRKWSSTVDLGYTRNSRILPTSTAISPREYSYFYAGGGLRRQIGRHFGIFASYQYNQQLFDSSFCETGTSCGPTTRRHVAFIGLDWRPSPIRLD
jgi:hypothetical protein